MNDARRVALVTGGARGLGRAIARELLAGGMEVHVVDIDTAGADARTKAQTIDLAAPEAERQLGAYVGSLPRLDVLVANAGIVPPWRRTAELDLDEWDRVFAVNVRGVALSLKCCAPRLAAEGGGAAVLMASINGYRAHPRQAAYTASKHAVIGLMRAAALDLGPDGVRVNALAPGPILTDALRGRIGARSGQGGPPPDAAIDALAAETALRRLATENDVARAACFLASDAAAGITGVCLPVEAGLA